MSGSGEAPVLPLPAEFFHAVVETQSEAVVTIDDRGAVAYFSPGAERLFGFTAAQVVGRNVSILMPPEEARRHDVYVQHHIATGEARIIGRTREVTGLTRDGRRIPIDLRVVALDLGGRRLFLGTMRDVSERRSREAALLALGNELKERNRRIDAALANIAEGVCMYDRDQRLIVVNGRYAAMLGLDEDAVMPGMSLRGALELAVAAGRFDPAIAAGWVEARMDLARSDRPGTISARMRDGRILRIAHAPLADGGAVDTVTDVTESERSAEILRAAAERAEAADRAKTQFLANMSHEIRTPMNGVLGMNTLLLDTPLDAEQRHYVQSAQSAANDLLRIIDDILDVSKLEAGRIELETIDFDLSALLGATVDLIAGAARGKDVALVEAIEPSARAHFRGDPTRLRQVLLNLLGNAVKFTERGTVTLAARCLPGAGGGAILRCDVTDTGIGIPDDVRSRLFQKFMQADSSTTRRYGGTGLGLAICRELIELMGGELGVASAPGRGSRFWFIVPLQAAPSPPASAPDPAASPPASRTGAVLVVEDNVINQRLAQALLVRAGHRVEIAGDGAQALVALGDADFDLVLMDLQMPVMDGLEAARRIRALPGAKGRVPIVALTADAMPDMAEICRASGMNDVLRKPFKIDSFLDVIVRWLSPDAAPAPGSQPSWSQA